jgi:hypothetical protein
MAGDGAGFTDGMVDHGTALMQPRNWALRLNLQF